MNINRALISEIKRRLPKNVNPPVTLELLLKQKAVEKIEHKDSLINEGNCISKKIIDNFIKNNLSKPFSSLKKKINMRQSIITAKKKLINLSNINKKFSTPFQIQHIKLFYQKKLINRKINKKSPHIEINKENKNVFGIFKKSQSCSSFNKRNNSSKIDGKYTLRSTINYNAINNNNKNKEIIYSFYNDQNIKSINDFLNNKYDSSRSRKKMKPNCYYNKLHLNKFHQYIRNSSI